MAGKAITFQVSVDECSGLPEDLCSNIFVTYTMKHAPNELHTTHDLKGYGSKHDINFKKIHSVDCITDYHIDNFDNGLIAFKVFGYPFYKGTDVYNEKAKRQDLAEKPKEVKWVPCKP